MCKNGQETHSVVWDASKVIAPPVPVRSYMYHLRNCNIKRVTGKGITQARQRKEPSASFAGEIGWVKYPRVVPLVLGVAFIDGDLSDAVRYPYTC